MSEVVYYDQGNIRISNERVEFSARLEHSASSLLNVRSVWQRKSGWQCARKTPILKA
jgi:hypothetical protein